MPLVCHWFATAVGVCHCKRLESEGCSACVRAYLLEPIYWGLSTRAYLSGPICQSLSAGAPASPPAADQPVNQLPSQPARRLASRRAPLPEPQPSRHAAGGQLAGGLWLLMVSQLARSLVNQQAGWAANHQRRCFSHEAARTLARPLTLSLSLSLSLCLSLSLSLSLFLSLSLSLLFFCHLFLTLSFFLSYSDF